MPTDTIPDYYNRVNPDLLRRLPADAQTVVEIGCGAGALGQAYKRRNPFVCYVGLEVNPAVTPLAAQRLDRVVTADVNQCTPADLGVEPGTVDVVVYGDVLEHLIDPWAVVARHVELLKPDTGVVLLCIPNVQHWSVVLSLLRGQWTYTDEGLLDRTHLRFFTLQGVRQLMAAAGLSVDEIWTRRFGLEGFERFQQIVRPILEPLGIDAAQFEKQTSALQYVVRATRSAAPPRRMLIQTLVTEPMVQEVRGAAPARFLSTIPGVHAVTSIKPADLVVAPGGGRKVFVLQRAGVAIADGMTLLKTLLQAGYLIVAEIDDDPHDGPADQKDDSFFLRAAHCVQCPTEPLAEYLRTINAHVGVFPNCLTELPPAAVRPPSTVATVLFAALNRADDYRPLLPALGQVLDRHRDQMRFQVVHDRAFFDALPTPHKTFHPVLPYEQYLALLGACDIALLPLQPNRVNDMKSDVDFLECAGRGSTVLASSTLYGGSVVDGQTGLLFASPEEFEERLTRLVTDAELRKRLAAAAYRWVAENRMLSQHFRRRYEWYKQMLDRLPELTDDLRRRTPELFV